MNLDTKKVLAFKTFQSFYMYTYSIIYTYKV